jgi:hypothetical protein
MDVTECSVRMKQVIGSRRPPPPPLVPSGHAASLAPYQSDTPGHAAHGAASSCSPGRAEGFRAAEMDKSWRLKEGWGAWGCASSVSMCRRAALESVTPHMAFSARSFRTIRKQRTSPVPSRCHTSPPAPSYSPSRYLRSERGSINPRRAAGALFERTLMIFTRAMSVSGRGSRALGWGRRGLAPFVEHVRKHLVSVFAITVNGHDTHSLSQRGALRQPISQNSSTAGQQAPPGRRVKWLRERERE